MSEEPPEVIQIGCGCIVVTVIGCVLLTCLAVFAKLAIVLWHWVSNG